MGEQGQAVKPVKGYGDKCGHMGSMEWRQWSSMQGGGRYPGHVTEDTASTSLYLHDGHDQREKKTMAW